MLASDDRQEVLRALRFIGEATGTVDFAGRMCQELLRLVPGISSSYNESNLAAKQVAAVIHPDPGREFFDRHIGPLRRNLRDNPLVRHFEATGDGGVVTWADLDPEGAFFDTPLYRDLYAPRGVRGQLGFHLPAPPGIHIAIVINRDCPGFTDRERGLVSELRVHLVNLFRLVSHAEASRQRDVALAEDGWTVVLVDNAGTVVKSNEAAVAIGLAAGVDLDVGARLWENRPWTMSGSHCDLWALSHHSRSETSGISLNGRAPAPSVSPRPRSGASVWQAPYPRTPHQRLALEARLLRSPVGPDLVWVREPSRIMVRRAIELGLTERQAQVAALLVDGLTNQQIARQLGIASGTVRKHLEATFARLHVSSRAAAVGRLQAARAGI
jgi:DNA-binding CsgD family transcriptional regulator